MNEHIHIHVHIHHEHDVEVHKKLDTLIKQGEKMAVDFAAFKQVLDNIDTETTRIATKVQEILDQLKAGGLTPDQEQQLFDQASSELGKLQSIGKEEVPGDNNPPV